MSDLSNILPEPRHKIWFKREQGRFLKKARLRAGLSVQDVARRTGIDIRWVERGEVNLSLRNLAFFVRLYGIPEESIYAWESCVRLKLREMVSQPTQH